MDVKTAGRTVDLFENFAKSREPMTLSEVARMLQAPQSSCFNLVRALEARGYLYAVGGAKRIYPTRKLFDIAEAIIRNEPIVPRLAPILASLRDECMETVILGARQGDKVIYLDVAEGPQTIRYISRAGELKPLHASAIGKALLLGLTAAERERALEKLKLKKITDRTITSIDTLLDEIERSEQRGYTQTKGENVVDVMAIAVPIRVDNVAYAVAIAGPVSRLDPEVSIQAKRLLKAFAKFR